MARKSSQVAAQTREEARKAEQEVGVARGPKAHMSIRKIVIIMTIIVMRIMVTIKIIMKMVVMIGQQS